MTKQIILVPTWLGMKPGKIASQCCHAAVKAVKDGWDVKKRIILKVGTPEAATQLRLYAQEVGCSTFVIVDEGITEVAPGSVTAYSIVGPEDKVDRVTGSLTLL